MIELLKPIATAWGRRRGRRFVVGLGVGDRVGDGVRLGDGDGVGDGVGLDVGLGGGGNMVGLGDRFRATPPPSPSLTPSLTVSPTPRPG